jgi:NAD-dependent deacetylase
MLIWVVHDLYSNGCYSSAMLNQRVLVITGAGISAESGIPTFRGSGGYWRNLDPARLATAEAFDRNPELVWEWYRERRTLIRAARPNQAHEAVVQLAHACSDFLLVTQNVDDLHGRARYQNRALPARQMAKIHGDIFLTRCSRCDYQFAELAQDLTDLPLCQECGALMRPGVVWFGEKLDPQQMARVDKYLSEAPCDLVLVIGTTAMFGYIIDWALRGSRLIEINPDATPLSGYASESIREPAGTALPRLVAGLIDTSR